MAVPAAVAEATALLLESTDEDDGTNEDQDEGAALDDHAEELGAAEDDHTDDVEGSTHVEVLVLVLVFVALGVVDVVGGTHSEVEEVVGSTHSEVEVVGFACLVEVVVSSSPPEPLSP